MMISVSNYMDGSHDLAVAHGQSDLLKPLQIRPLNFISSHSSSHHDGMHMCKNISVRTTIEQSNILLKQSCGSI